MTVPFTTQAPTGNWEGNKNCEEASAVMAAAYLHGDTRDEMPADFAQQEISKLVQWEENHFHYNADTGAAETAQMIEGALQLKTSIIHDFTEDDLKKNLLSQQVILLPLNAQILATDHYSDLHPTYHMVIIHGYNSKGFLVHDPGTTKGKNNLYTFEELKKAAADWDNPHQRMDQGKKVAIVVSKEGF